MVLFVHDFSCTPVSTPTEASRVLGDCAAERKSSHDVATEQRWFLTADGTILQASQKSLITPSTLK